MNNNDFMQKKLADLQSDLEGRKPLNQESKKYKTENVNLSKTYSWYNKVIWPSVCSQSRSSLFPPDPPNQF